MTCTYCQNEMKPQERFCSKCGTDSFAKRDRPSIPSGSRNWDAHVKVLGWIFIISAMFMAIPGLSLMLFPRMMMHSMFPPSHFGSLLFFPIGLAFISIPAGIIVAGVGLLKYREWARFLTVILAAFMLIAFPFGTAIGIYAFWVLLSTEGSRSYKQGGPSPDGKGEGHPVMGAR